MAQRLPGCCGTLSVASLAPSYPVIGTVTRRSFKPQGIVFSPCSKCSQGFPPPSGSRPSFLVGHSTFPNPALLLSPTSLGLLERGVGSLHPSPSKNYRILLAVCPGSSYSFQNRADITFFWKLPSSLTEELPCPSGWLPLDLMGSITCSGPGC